MANEFRTKEFSNEPQNIWKSQTTEAFKMSADQLRRKADERQDKARFEAGYSVAAGLAVCAFFAWTSIRPNEMLTRIGAGVLSLWGIYYAYQAYQSFRQKRLAPDATLNTTVQVYRSALEQQRDYGRNVWRRAGLPFCILGVALGLAPAMVRSIEAPREMVRFVPVLVLFVVWLVVFFFVRKRRRERLQQEIDELRGFELQNRA